MIANSTSKIIYNQIRSFKPKANRYFVRLFLNKPMILLLIHAEHSNLVAQQTFMFFLIATLSKDFKMLLKDWFTTFILTMMQHPRK